MRESENFSFQANDHAFAAPQSEAPQTPELGEIPPISHIADTRLFIREFEIIQDGINGYTEWKLRKPDPYFDSNSKKQRKETIRQNVSEAIWELHSIKSTPNDDTTQEKESSFREKWAEQGDEYKHFYELLKPALQEAHEEADKINSGELEADTRGIGLSAAANLKDMSVEQRSELLLKLGYDSTQVSKIIKTLGISLALTGVTAGSIEFGGPIAEVYGATHPHLEGFPDLKAMGVVAGSYATYWSATALAAFQQVRLAREGLPSSNFAASLGVLMSKKFFPKDEEQQNKFAFLLAITPELILEVPYMLSAFVPNVGTSALSDANFYGTAAMLMVSAVSEVALRSHIRSGDTESESQKEIIPED